MKAKLLLHGRQVYGRGFVEYVIWKLPKPDEERPHGLEYRLAYVADGRRVVGYDNERRKGDHKHIKGHEYPYQFVNEDKLIDDFLVDIKEVEDGQDTTY